MSPQRGAMRHRRAAAPVRVQVAKLHCRGSVPTLTTQCGCARALTPASGHLLHLPTALHQKTVSSESRAAQPRVAARK